MSFRLKTKAAPGRLPNRLAYTTGQIAIALEVAPRTVSKWCHDGLLYCYRLPGTQDRRIPRDSLIRFIRDNEIGIEVKGLEESLLLISNDLLLAEHLTAALEPHDITLAVADDWFTAGGAMTHPHGAVIIDLWLGRYEGIRACRAALAALPHAARIVLSCEDEPNLQELADAGATLVIQRPVDVARLIESLVE